MHRIGQQTQTQRIADNPANSATMSSMKRRRRWVWIFLLLGAVVCVIWFLPLGESEAQRLKAELEARGECFTVEALGLGTTNDDPTWLIFEETAPWFNAMSNAQVDPARGVKHENDRAQPPQVVWKQPFLYPGHSGWVLEWDRATAIADRVQPELAPLREALRNPTARSAWETEALGNGPLHSFLPLRVAAQGFHDLLQVELRRGTIDRALTNC
jgi:hypothetical protein